MMLRFGRQRLSLDIGDGHVLVHPRRVKVGMFVRWRSGEHLMELVVGKTAWILLDVVFTGR